MIIAGTGIGWVNAGADYARYLPHKSKGQSIAWWTILGSTIPLFVLILPAAVLSSKVSNLATAANPIQAIGSALPSWIAVPYLATPIVALIVKADLSSY